MANYKYRNREWLYDKYWNRELSITKISKLYGINRETISYWIKKLNTTIRSLSESIHLARINHCRLSPKAIEWLGGELLGDACLTTTAKKGDLPSKNLSALFRYGSKYEEYINYISKTLKSFGVKQSGKIRKYTNKKGNIAYHYNSLSYAELFPIYNKWYPDGKKIIPEDLELTPLTLRQHYIGDGSLIHQKRNTRIILSTCGYLIKDVNWMIKKLDELRFKVTRQPSTNAILISSYSVKDFLNYIGKCPVSCYQYKWAF